MFKGVSYQPGIGFIGIKEFIQCPLPVMILFGHCPVDYLGVSIYDSRGIFKKIGG